MRIFPYGIMRSAEIAYDNFSKPTKENNDLSLNLSNNIIIKKKNIIKKENLSHALQLLIDVEKNNIEKKKIKKLKKKIQSESEIYLDDFICELDTKVNGLFLNYLKECKYYSNCQRKNYQLYCSVLNNERENLISIFNKKSLKNALLLSSQTLLGNFNKYEKKKNIVNKKFNQLEYGMYKYSSRASTKTSPFSSFTNIGILKFSEKEKKILNNLGKFSSSKESKIKFNSHILRHIIICLKTIKKYRLQFFLRPNPSIFTKESYYHFFINRQNLETFQSLKKNEITELILNALDLDTNYEKLLNFLIEQIDDNEENIELYLLDLIRSGFIEIHPGFSELDVNWEKKLLDFIYLTDETSILVREFKKMVLAKKLYETSNSVKKRMLFQIEIKKSYDSIIDLLVKKSDYIIKQNDKKFILFYPKNSTHIPEFAFQKIQTQNAIYEDVFILSEMKISSNQIYSVVSKLNSLASQTKLYSNASNDYFDVLNFYSNNYSGKAVDLLTFYENYYKYKLQKDKLNKQEGFQKFQNNTTRQFDQILKTRKKWEILLFNEILKHHNSDQTEFYMSLEMIKSTNEKLGLSNDFSKNSYSSFFQFYFDNSKGQGDDCIVGISSSINSGYGKLYSRFLYGVSGKVLDELKEWNDHLLLDDDSIFVENFDSSLFNANLHPPIMEFEIQIPGVKNLRGDSKAILLKDLEIRVDLAKQEIQLYHKKANKRVFVFDLCFQSVSGRSNLYQFLELFSKAENISTSYLNNFYRFLNTENIQNNDFKIRFYPRVIFENTLILRKCQWVIPKKLITLNTKISDFEEYIFYNEWRHSLNIPNEIFVRIAKRPNSKKSTGNFKKDDYKPQYINFSSPISVRYFGRLLKKAEDTITIEEMLPNGENLSLLNNKKNVSEFLIQWQND